VEYLRRVPTTSGQRHSAAAVSKAISSHPPEPKPAKLRTFFLNMRMQALGFYFRNSLPGNRVTFVA